MWIGLTATVFITRWRPSFFEMFRFYVTYFHFRKIDLSLVTSVNLLWIYVGIVCVFLPKKFFILVDSTMPTKRLYSRWRISGSSKCLSIRAVINPSNTCSSNNVQCTTAVPLAFCSEYDLPLIANVVFSWCLRFRDAICEIGWLIFTCFPRGLSQLMHWQ